MIEQLIEAFHYPVDKYQSTSDNKELKRRMSSWWVNKAMYPMAETSGAHGIIRHVELLHDTPVLDGLSNEASWALSRLGSKDISVLTMKFKRRNSGLSPW